MSNQSREKEVMKIIKEQENLNRRCIALVNELLQRLIPVLCSKLQDKSEVKDAIADKCKVAEKIDSNNSTIYEANVKLKEILTRLEI